MKRPRHAWRVAAFVLGGVILQGGCAKEAAPPCEILMTPHLLFGRDGSGLLAVRVGRHPWPVAEGPRRFAEDTIYFEYYRDYQGHAAQERNNPTRWFTSYRLGAERR